MRPDHNSNRRWQFSLGALFATLTLAAFLSAAISGSFGEPVRHYVMSLSTLVLAILVGGVSYLLLILLLMLLLGSPLLLLFGGRKLASRIRSRRITNGREDDPSPTGQESSAKGAPR